MQIILTEEEYAELKRNAVSEEIKKAIEAKLEQEARVRFNEASYELTDWLVDKARFRPSEAADITARLHSFWNHVFPYPK